MAKNKLKKIAKSRALKVIEDEDVPIPHDAEWSIDGELALSCSCELFCPCVVSLGQHPPTHGFCHAWIAARIDRGRYGNTKLNGLNICLLVDIPGKMGAGNWTVALYIDDTANDAQYAALEKIFTGSARGTTGLFRLLVGNYLGARREIVDYETNGEMRTISAGKAVFGEVAPINGADPEHYVTVENTSYWMGPSVIIAQARKSKIRDFGRVWNFDGGSAELCEINWSGP
ncbi:MAG: DUF1326 domain-containing protein [Pseudomonadota bacterium]